MATNRRQFLQSTAAAGLAGSVTSGQTTGARKISANDTIQVALIGAGGMGSADAETAQRVKGVKLVAACDVYDGRLTRAREEWGDRIFTTRDYREILARPDIDAVIIGTPDHWHATIAADAMKAGKDVYVEKPMVQKIPDGHMLIDTQKSTNRVLQVGSQYFEAQIYTKARDLLRQGAIGQLNMVEAWWDRNSSLGAWQYSMDPNASTSNIDWDRFLGPAPKRPFEPIRLFRWRNYRDYGTGVAGDLFVHLFTSLHYVTGSLGPSRIFGTGGLRFWKDGRDVPDVMLGLYEYPKTEQHPAFNLALRVNFVNGSGETSGFRFIGSEGIINIGNTLTLMKTPREAQPGYSIDTFAKKQREEFLADYAKKYPPEKMAEAAGRPEVVEEYQGARGDNAHLTHHRTFFDAVRSRKPVYENPLTGLRAAGPALATNMSYFEQREVDWDPQTAQVKG